MPSQMPASPMEAEPAIAQLAAQLADQGQSVEILALSQDFELLSTLREAGGTQQRICHAPTREQAVELIMTGRVGVIIVDTPITGAETGTFCDRLRLQFPDLILLVAGSTDDQTQLVKQITSGDIYRFLHKPVSPARARQFMDAAVRRHLEGRTFTPATTAPVGRSSAARFYLGAGAILLALVAAVAFFLTRDHTPAPDPAKTTPAPVQSPIATPDDARRNNPSANPTRATTPSVAASAAQNHETHEDPDQVADRLLTNAETALLESRLEDAARDIEGARAARPNNMRLAFLSAQLAKERERRLIAVARQAADQGNLGRARSMLDQAIQAQRTPSTALLEARRDIERRRLGQNTDNLLKLASARLQEGRLIEPEGDSAKSYIEAALAADPANATAIQARRALADETLARAHEALAQGDLNAANSWLGQAQSLGAAGAGFAAVQRELQAGRQVSARSDEQNRLLNLVNERLGQKRLLEPAGDSAQFYWLTLKAFEPANPGLQPALQALGGQLVERARQALAQRDLDTAQSTLDAARGLGFNSTELVAVSGQLGVARERAAFLANVVPATTLARDRFVDLKYPADAARRGVEGWVEMEFTVAIDGSVKDLELRGATPPGEFESAAVAAVSKWKYRPVVRNGRAVEQRARLRLKFELQN